LPEVDFTIRWANGETFAGTSPSRAMERFIIAGAAYPQGELLRRVTDGLSAASDRVRERYGVACTQAMEESQSIAAAAAGRDPQAIAQVLVMDRHLPEEDFPAPDRLEGEVEMVIVGGGQAGLSLSWWLAQHGVRHVVLERARIANAWQAQRWDAFCLVTPNFQCRLPEFPYAGSEPDGFMLREEIIEYVKGFASSFSPPVHEGVEVTAIRPEGDGFLVETSHGELTAGQVALCIGGYHRPRLPALAGALDPRITQLHSSTYRNPESLPDGAVLVVGSGQSGAQIAEDLLIAGRDVHLAVGSAPRVARFYRGRDCIAWLEDIGHYRMPIEEHPEGLSARHEPNHYMTGRDGGHDIDLRAFALRGMTLHGRLADASDGRLGFAGDLPKNLDAADATMERIKDTIDGYIEREGIDAPTEERYVPVWQPEADGSEPLDLAASSVRSIVWATGFLSDWSFVDAPFLDPDGYPTHERGVCSRVPGLYVLGLPWLHTWGSGRFAAISPDAEHVASAVADRVAVGVAGDRSERD
jgi:putative flavoprotein involved in K+ transport